MIDTLSSWLQDQRALVERVTHVRAPGLPKGSHGTYQPGRRTSAGLRRSCPGCHLRNASAPSTTSGMGHCRRAIYDRWRRPRGYLGRANGSVMRTACIVLQTVDPNLLSLSKQAALCRGLPRWTERGTPQTIREPTCDRLACLEA